MSSRGRNRRNPRRKDNQGEDEEDQGMGGPRFFKILHSSFIQNDHFGIPPKFVRKYGKDLSDIAILQVPNGLIWRVELKKDKKDYVLFQNGLAEFLEYYSLRSGHFLMFVYEGNSNFHVLIFDMNGCEINYHPSSHHSDEEPNTDNQHYNVGSSRGRSPEDLSVEDNIQTCSDDNDNDNNNVSSSEDDLMINIGIVERPTVNKKREKNKKKSAPMRRRSNSSIRTQERAKKIDKEFKSKHPFFTVAIQSAYVHHKFLPIPARFKGRNMLENMESITVEVPDGRSWPLSVISKGKDFRLSRGVVDFLNGNGLVEGHVCVFEMVMKESEFVLKAHIYCP